MYYCGYKQTLLSTVDGLPIAFDWVPGTKDKREAVASILESVRGATIYADKAFLRYEWQAQVLWETDDAQSNNHSA